MTPTIRLKPQREASILRRHPWIFSGAIADVTGNPSPGEVVSILDSAGNWLSWAAYSPQSQIRARIWSWNQEDVVDAGFVISKIRSSIARRTAFQKTIGSDALRLVHGESDGVPGLIVDRFGDIFVIQLLSWGVEVWRDAISRFLADEMGATCVIERSDAEVRNLEGLEEKTGLLAGSSMPDKFSYVEHGINYTIDFAGSHKTGSYLDQRANRAMIRDWVRDKDILDSFCYTGGFGLNALKGGAASVHFLDSSPIALDGLRANLENNQFENGVTTVQQGDVFQALRQFRDAARSFDVIVMDPPKFAPTRAHAEKAARAYKDINLLAFKLLRPGGSLITFSCSGGIDADLFQKIVAGAGLDAGADARILARLSQDIDHPVALNFPEGSYLKGLLCQVA